jgi:hypothetical protein
LRKRLKNAPVMSNPTNRLEELQNIPDSEIDTSDIPELDHTFWGTAKMKPNRFAVHDGKELLKVVILDEDVAQVFTPPESVNKVLRNEKEITCAN